MSKHPVTNMQRATWAENALKVFTKETYAERIPKKLHPGDLQCAVQDLITDLMHYWNQTPRKEAEAISPRELLDRAYNMYEAELIDPDLTEET